MYYLILTSLDHMLTHHIASFNVFLHITVEPSINSNPYTTQLRIFHFIFLSYS